MREYIVRIVQATRSNPNLELGASPRAALGLFRAAQALAAIRDRTYVIPDDIKELGPSILAHRIIVSPQTRLRGRTSEEILEEILATIPIPLAADPPVG